LGLFSLVCFDSVEIVVFLLFFPRHTRMPFLLVLVVVVVVVESG
jgi:hypothetical protein